MFALGNWILKTWASVVSLPRCAAKYHTAGHPLPAGWDGGEKHPCIISTVLVINPKHSPTPVTMKKNNSYHSQKQYIRLSQNVNKNWLTCNVKIISHSYNKKHPQTTQQLSMVLKKKIQRWFPLGHVYVCLSRFYFEAEHIFLYFLIISEE